MRSIPFIPGLVLISLVSVSLAGCGTFRDRSHDYRQARPIEPLVVPESLGETRLGDSYAVPGLESHSVLPGRFDVPRPDPLRKDSEQGTVRVQRLGDERWILVEGTPGQLWPRLRGFMSLARMSVARSDATGGIIETAWLQRTGSDDRERYRFRIEQGVQRATSEIYLIHASARRAGEQWPEQSSDPEREEEIVMALAQYLADTDVMGSVSMLAERGSDTRGRVFLADSEEYGPYIRLHLPFDRSWAALPLALDRAGFTVQDRNRDQGRYWVSFVDPDQREPGRFRRLFGARKAEPAFYWVDIRPAAGKAREMIITIKTQDGEGEALTEAEQTELLKRIKGFIS